MCPLLLHPSKKHLAYYQHLGTPQLIFLSKKGPVIEILKKSFQLIDMMLCQYSKTTAVLIQLHQAHATRDNRLVATMMSQLKAALGKHYKCEVGYFWVREQEHADSQHYHAVVIVSGHKCQCSKLVDHLVQDIWQRTDPNNYSYQVRNRIYRVNRGGNTPELRALRMRLSYMAKKEGKQGFASRTHSYGCSRFKVRI